MPTPASPAGTWCNHTLERKRSTLGRSSGEAFMPRRCFCMEHIIARIHILEFKDQPHQIMEV